VALFDDRALIATLEREARGDVILTLIDELLREKKIAPRDVATWAVDVGPGSFTGVRIGVATVKGIAFSTGAKVIAVNAFDAVCAARSLAPRDACVMLEAGKGEVYFRIGESVPSHAPRDAVIVLMAGRKESIVENVTPRAEDVGRVALTQSATDLDRIEPLYVRAPDLVKSR
jgi:tRNA threonylcarbamoyl adenosine modification protein YeaZ